MGYLTDVQTCSLDSPVISFGTPPLHVLRLPTPHMSSQMHCEEKASSPKANIFHASTPARIAPLTATYSAFRQSCIQTAYQLLEQGDIIIIEGNQMLSQHQHAVPPSDLSSLQEVQNRLTDLRAGCSMKLCDDRMQIWSIVLETRSYLKSAKEWRISVEKALPQLNNDQNQTFSGTRSRSIPSRSYSLLSSITEILPVALSKFPKGSMTNLKECLSEDDPSLLHNDPSAPQCTGHPTKWVSVARRSATLPTPSETHAVTDCTSVTEPSFNLWLETYLRSNVFDEDTSKKIRDMIYHVPIDKELDKSTLEDIHMLIVDSGRLIDASSFIQELVRRRVQPEQCFKELTTAILPRAGSRPSRSQTFPPINEVRDEAVETVESMLPAYLDFSHAVGHVDAEEV